MYDLEFHEKVTDDIQCFPKEIKKTIFEAIRERLSVRPYDFKALSGKEFKGFYRLRVSDYRIVYTIDEEYQKVRILAIGHRSRIYRFLSKRF